MLAHSIFFYFFSVIAILSSLMVITSRSSVNSVFFLILDFISVGCLFIMVGAEFLGMIILIVYVGAVAVLFLFVVMMLNVAEQKQSWFIGKQSTHIPSGLIVSILILLLSMIGAILLTFRERVGVKRQSYIKQISRNPSSAIELKNVESNKGVKIDD